MKFEVYTNYLKSYLSYLIQIYGCLWGPEMLTFRNHMASDMQNMYEQQGIHVRDPLMVTLPKSHKAVSTAVNFGETVGRAGYQPYCTDTYGSKLKKPHYDAKLTKSCNPKGFDKIPVARVSSHIANTDMQIRGIRVEIKKTFCVGWGCRVTSMFLFPRSGWRITLMRKLGRRPSVVSKRRNKSYLFASPLPTPGPTIPLII